MSYSALGRGVEDIHCEVAFLGISSDPYVQPEDGLTGKGRNM